MNEAVSGKFLGIHFCSQKAFFSFAVLKSVLKLFDFLYFLGSCYVERCYYGTRPPLWATSHSGPSSVSLEVSP